MKIKKKTIVKPFVLALAASQCMTAYAGTWISTAQNQWSYIRDDGSKQPGGWFTDPADKRIYYLDDAGVIISGWRQIDGIWYFFNTVHDGTFGSALTSRWQWIDGYCYLFDESGKMYANTTTPDGFLVNADGQWVENQTAVYVAGKGIQTKITTNPTNNTTVTRSSGGGGGGGGGSHSSGTNASAKTTYYTYTVRYIDTEGNILATTTGETAKDSFVDVFTRSFSGYEFVSGQTGPQKVTADQTVFVVTYKKTAAPVEKEYSYTVRYIDQDTGDILDTVTGKAKAGSSVTVKNEINGYTPNANNAYTFTVTNDQMQVSLYFTKKKEICSYTIRYVDEENSVLEEISGTVEKGTQIMIPERTFTGYTRITDVSSFIVKDNDCVITIHYRKTVDDRPVETPSEPEKELYDYTITYIDKDTGIVKMKESGSASKGTEIIPAIYFDGYQYADAYKFKVTDGKNAFKVYLISSDEPEIFADIEYTVICVDEQGKELKVFRDTVSVGNSPVDVETNYQIDGYELGDQPTISVSKYGNNQFTLHYIRKTNARLMVICRDIDTMQEIEVKEIKGNSGESVDLSNICPDGYLSAGDLPDNVTISSNDDNNIIYLYFKKKSENEDTKKEARYVIQFRAYGDHDTYVMNDVNGTWPVGEKFSYYFAKTYNDAQGRSWTAVGDSPQIFEMKDQEVNTFLIEFVQTGSEDVKDTTRSYTIKYVAEDTGSILGVTTGIGTIGERIPYVNTFDGYGFADTENNFHVINAEDNAVEVTLKRNKFPGPEVNPNTGKYDGFEWLALFVDSNGNQLLPNVSGFTVKGDRLYFQYPDEIESNGVTYRAVSPSPYIEYTDQTTYRQYVIQYVTGDPSEDKLEEWKQKAQEKKDAFYGTTPFHYFVAYREKDSWNDIGLQFGIAPKDTRIELEELDMPGWIAPKENLGSFILDTDGQIQAAQYEKPNGGTSIDYNEREYTIRIVDEKENDLYPPYSGKIAFVKGNSQVDFPVYYPEYFYDAEGNRWEADDPSPKNFVMSAMSKNEQLIRYHKVYENEKEQFIVTDNIGFNKILNDFASHTNDASRHEYYVIGRGYDVSSSEVSQTMSKYNLAGYSNEVVDAFELNGVSYTVSRVSYYRKWEHEACDHDWEAQEDLTGSCLTSTRHTLKCRKCKEEVTVIVPAVGHMDKNHDGSCDTCGIRLSQNLGDQITVTWNSGSLGFGEKKITFTCIDTDYEGTGKMLYIASEGIGKDIYGTYTTAESAGYSSSTLHQFLNDEFADGLSVKDNLQAISGEAASILTKEEYDHYLSAAENQFDFPSGTYLTKTSTDDQVTLTDGSNASREDASAYEAYPIILLNRSEDDTSVRSEVWNEGDLQAREINGKIYLFRCVKANYTDKSNTDKSMALFLCDTVIPSNEGLGFDEADETQSTRFFGDTNNYKYSTINEWLSSHIPDNHNFVRTNIGIKNEYTGSSSAGTYGSVSEKSFNRFTRATSQVMYSSFFIPSLEEALAMKDQLWKFNHSDQDNPGDIRTKYRSAYWLRTPMYGTDDMVYTVNLQTGAIEPRSVKATQDNDLCDIGIRPMYVLYQND